MQCPAFFMPYIMKKIQFLFLALLITSVANAQSENLPVDENGKLIYYEVVAMKDASRDSLKQKLDLYFKKQKELKVKSSKDDSTFLASGKLIINKTLLVMSHPSGEILYNFNAEVKEGKYRFWLTDFSFIPYQRDRYGNFVATTAKGTPLEADPGKLNAGQWKEYQAQTAKYAQVFAEKLKQHMASKRPIVIPAPEKKVVSKSW